MLGLIFGSQTLLFFEKAFTGLLSVLWAILDGVIRLLPYAHWICIFLIVFFLYLNSHAIYISLAKGGEVAASSRNMNGDEHHRIIVVVPTYNESTTIRKKLEDLLSLSYPPDRFVIAVVDGASTDDTVQLALDFKRERGEEEPKLYVIRQDSRSGKSDGILFCLKQIQFGDIVLVTDANCHLKPDSLIKAEREFRDPHVGGVTIRMEVPASSDSWVSDSERFYWNLMNRQRISVSRKGLFFHFNGAFQMTRRDLAIPAFEVTKFTYAIDMIGGMAVVLSGHTVVYLGETSIVESGISTAVDLIRQKRNRTIGLIDAARFFYRAKSPAKRQYRISAYLKTIVPVSSPVVFLALVLLLLFLIPLDLFFLLLAGGLILALFIPQVRYFTVVQIAIIGAILAVAAGRRGRFWTKTESDRLWPDLDPTNQLVDCR